MIDLILGLRRRYAEAPDVWVGGNFFLCYERGNPNAHVSPDVMVARGVEKKRRRPNYLLWQETSPSLVVEVTSRSTRREDMGKKKDLYQRIGVEEYVGSESTCDHGCRDTGSKRGVFGPFPWRWTDRC